MSASEPVGGGLPGRQPAPCLRQISRPNVPVASRASSLQHPPPRLLARFAFAAGLAGLWLWPGSAAAQLEVRADLAVAIVPSANPVSAGHRVTFKLYVANHGPMAATDVQVTNTIPAGLDVISTWSSQGTFAHDGSGTVVFAVGNLDPGGTALAGTELQAGVDGSFTNTAVVGASLPDPDAANNTAEVVLAVCADCDEDGILDSWEWLYGFDPQDPTDAALDLDGDGLTNLEEFQNGTNPFFNDLPAILSEPGDQEANTGDTVQFSVLAEGTEPLSYTWLHRGEPIANATHATLVLSNVTLTDGGPYVARVANPYGASFSQPAYLTLDVDRSFRILELTSQGVVGTDVDSLIGDDRGGIAVTTNRVLLTGDNGTGIWNLNNLGGGANVGRTHNSLVSDLRSGAAFVLAAEGQPLSSSGQADSLVLLDPANGSLSTDRVNFSEPVPLSWGAGIFAGYGCVVLYDPDTRQVAHVALPEGTVSWMGQVPFLDHQYSENWAFWGIAEYFGGSLHLVYVRDSQAIVRTHVADGQTRVLAAFEYLGDMASITFSPVLSRWFFHHEGSSQLYSGSEVLGSAQGRFTANTAHPFIREITGDRTGIQGDEVRLRVLATGAEPLQYQWWFGDQLLTSATNATLVLAPAHPTNSGLYRVVVSNPFGAETLDATLKVLGAPVILTQPRDLVRPAQMSAVFLLTIEGAPPLAYQWLFNGTPLTDATNAALQLDALTTNQAGAYSVVVSNAFGTLTSAEATLTLRGSGAIRVGIFGAPGDPDWNEDVREKVESTLLFDRVEATMVNDVGPTLDDLLQYEAVLVYSDAGFYDSQAFGDLLADYVETGGGVVVATFALYNFESIGLQGRIRSAGYLPFTSEGQNSGTPLTMVIEAPEHPIFEGVATFSGGSASYHNAPVVLAPEAVRLARWSDGEPLVGIRETQAGRLVALNFYPPSGDLREDFWDASTDGAYLMGNALLWAAGGGVVGDRPPAIVRQPADALVIAGNTASFTVAVAGTAPLSYQWLFNELPIPNGTNATLLVPDAQPANAGTYSVVITNAFGTATSDPATLELAFDDQTQFRILALSSENSRTIEVNQLTGDDRGGIAASTNQVFLTGDSATARFSLTDLSGGARVGAQWNGMVADLRSQTVYLLGNGGSPLEGAGTVTSLLELNGSSGQRTGREIHLSQSIPAGYGSGLFSGYARVLIHTGSKVYSIQLPSGLVLDLGTMNSFGHQGTENWAYWGIAERLGGTNYLVYVEGFQQIVRRRVPDGEREVVGSFDSLSDMASITVSIPRGRWYFHHEGSSQFFSGDESLGYADATFMVDSGVYAARYAWAPLDPLQPVGSPFPAALQALNTASQVVTNFIGSVTLSARTATGQLIPVEPATVSNFVAGVWNGEITLPQPAQGVTLFATDATGATGASNPFDAANEFGLFLSVAPDPVAVGGHLTNRVTLVNTGPGTATGVRLTNTLPLHVEVITASAPSGGACAQADGQIICELPDLPLGAVARIEIVLQPALPGTLTNTFAAHRNEPDPNPANNTAVSIVTVLAPPLVIDDVAIMEGHSGATPVTFTVRLLHPSTNSVTVQYATANGTATGGRDFTQRSGLLTFPPNVTTQTLTVTVTGDTRYEYDETFPVNLLNPTGASLGKAEGTCTILNDDSMPSLSVSDASIVEGDAGTTNITFTLRLSAAPGVPVEVQWTNTSGTAIAGIDYADLSGAIVFPADFIFLSRNINIPILGDLAAEPDKTFTINLLAPVNATVADGEGLGTIVDNDIQFVWDPIPSPQPLNVPFPVTVRAQTYDGTQVTTFNESVTLSASIGSIFTNQVGFGTTTNSFPMSVWSHDERLQVIYTAAEIGRAGPITALALDITQAPGIALNNWTLRLKHTALSQYEYPSQWEGSGWTVVSQGTAPITGTGWTRFPFATPFNYNGTNNLIVDFSYANTTSSETYGFVRHSVTNAPRALLGQTMNYWGYPDPLEWVGNGNSGNVPFPQELYEFPNARFIMDSVVSIPVSPIRSGTFTQGVWSGTVQVVQTNTGITLAATSPSQHSGRSNPFSVRNIQTADLAVIATAPATILPVGSEVTLRLTLTNLGPSQATFLMLTNPLPPGLAFVSATANPGSVSHQNGVLTYNLVSLAAGAGAEVTALLRATTPGLFTNTAGVRSNLPDPVPANNRAPLVFEILCDDCDNDGLPDAWELEQGFDPANAADAGEDADGDQMTNYEEFLAGTDPHDAHDVLVLQFERVPNSPDVSLYFTGKTHHKYALERAPQPTGPWSPIAVFKLGTLPTVRLTDFGAAAADSYFYRVRAL